MPPAARSGQASASGPTDAQLAAFIHSSLGKGKDPHELLAELHRRGVAAHRAESAVLQGMKETIANKLRRRGRNEALIGGGILALGLGITMFTYLVADVGETFVVTTGLLLVGSLGIGRGIWTATYKARRALKD